MIHDPDPRMQSAATAYLTPPLRSTFLIPQLFDWSARHNGSHPFRKDAGASTPAGKAPGEWHITNYSRFASLVNSAAHHFDHESYEIPLRTSQNAAAGMKPPVVVFIAGSDVATLASQIGLMKRGCATFPISPRNTPAIILDLIRACSATHILYALPFHTLIEAIVAIHSAQAEKPGTSLKTMPLPGLQTLEKTAVGCSGFPYDFELDQEIDQLVGQAYAVSVQPSRCPRASAFWNDEEYPWLPDTSMDTMLVPVPLFHLMGWVAGPLASISSGQTGAYTPAGPPPPGKVLLDLVRASGSAHAIFVPSQLDEIARDDEDIKALVGLRSVIYGGAPLSPQTFLKLDEAGVKLSSGYGLTEVGPLGKTHITPHPGHVEPLKGAWITLRSDHAYRFDQVREEGHELVVVSKGAARVNVETAPGIYATGDLVEIHLELPRTIKCVGRRGDLIVLANGENVSSKFHENEIAQHPWVDAALVFGHARWQCGLLVDLHRGHQFDSSDPIKLAHARAEIWPRIEAANSEQPGYAKIFREMIVFTSAGKPVLRSDKSTIQRKPTLTLYHKEIEDVYAAVNKNAVTVTPLRSLERDEVAQMVASIVQSIMGSGTPLRSKTQLTDVGLDSLRATLVRASILSALRNAQAAGVAGESEKIASQITQNFAFEHSSIKEMTDAIVNIAANGAPLHDQSDSVELMRTYITKYGEGFTPSTQRVEALPRQTRGHVVLLTGSTGALGCALLEQLVVHDGIDRIICLNRPASTASSKDRQVQAFRARLLDNSPALSDKVSYVDDKAPFEELKLPEVPTIILHCAWPVNFALRLAGFERDIAGVRTLLDLAATNSSHFLFVSSIAAVQAAGESNLEGEHSTAPFQVSETTVADPAWAVGGYGQSEAVCEHLISAAVRVSGVDAASIRCGQIMGDTRSGAWNAQEWFPRVISSVDALEGLPDGLEDADWISAATIIRLALAPKLKAATVASPSNAINLINPRTVSWRSVLQSFSPHLPADKVNRLAYIDWLHRLRSKVSVGENSSTTKPSLVVPAAQLLDTFEALAQRKRGMALTIGEAMDVCPDLMARAAVLDEHLAGTFVAFWRSEHGSQIM